MTNVKIKFIISFVIVQTLYIVVANSSKIQQLTVTRMKLLVYHIKLNIGFSVSQLSKKFPEMIFCAEINATTLFEM